MKRAEWLRELLVVSLLAVTILVSGVDGSAERMCQLKIVQLETDGEKFKSQAAADAQRLKEEVEALRQAAAVSAEEMAQQRGELDAERAEIERWRKGAVPVQSLGRCEEKLLLVSSIKAEVSQPLSDMVPRVEMERERERAFAAEALAVSLSEKLGQLEGDLTAKTWAAGASTRQGSASSEECRNVKEELVRCYDSRAEEDARRRSVLVAMDGKLEGCLRSGHGEGTIAKGEGAELAKCQEAAAEEGRSLRRDVDESRKETSEAQKLLQKCTQALGVKGSKVQQVGRYKAAETAEKLAVCQEAEAALRAELSGCHASWKELNITLGAQISECGALRDDCMAVNRSRLAEVAVLHKSCEVILGECASKVELLKTEVGEVSRRLSGKASSMRECAETGGTASGPCAGNQEVESLQAELRACTKSDACGEQGALAHAQGENAALESIGEVVGAHGNAASLQGGCRENLGGCREHLGVCRRELSKALRDVARSKVEEAEAEERDRETSLALKRCYAEQRNGWAASRGVKGGVPDKAGTSAAATMEAGVDEPLRGAGYSSKVRVEMSSEAITSEGTDLNPRICRECRELLHGHGQYGDFFQRQLHAHHQIATYNGMMFISCLTGATGLMLAYVMFVFE